MHTFYVAFKAEHAKMVRQTLKISQHMLQDY